MNIPCTTNIASEYNLAVVLVEPRIPQNAGNIARLCACTGTQLILVGDLGFSFHEKHAKRAGMDYLTHIEPKHFPDFPDVLEAYPGWTYSFLSSKAQQIYTQAPFQNDHLLVFGSEETGLPARLINNYPHLCYRIPMLANRSSLNLSTSVGIVLYEALRQLEKWPTITD